MYRYTEKLINMICPKDLNAEESEVIFGMNARKPSEGVAIATLSEDDEAVAQKVRRVPEERA